MPKKNRVGQYQDFTSTLEADLDEEQSHIEIGIPTTSLVKTG